MHGRRTYVPELRVTGLVSSAFSQRSGEESVKSLESTEGHTTIASIPKGSATILYVIEAICSLRKVFRAEFNDTTQGRVGKEKMHFLLQCGADVTERWTRFGIL